MHHLVKAAALCVLLLMGATASAQSTITVCTVNCDFPSSNLQGAMDAADPGDTILIEQGYTFIDTFVMNEKAACPAVAPITVRTGVTADGTLVSLTEFPIADVRITPAYQPNLAKLKGAPSQNGSVEPALETAAWPAIVCGWRWENVEFEGNAFGKDTIIRIGSDDNNEQPVLADAPSDITFDRVYFHGQPVQKIQRGISIHGPNVNVINSYGEHIASVGSDGQVVWVSSTNGPNLIENNYLNGATETLLTAGTGGSGRPNATVQASPAPTTTGARLSETTALEVGQGVTFNVAGVEQYTEIVSINGLDVTFAPALTAAPDVPGDVDWSVLVKNLTVRKNHLTRPLSWRNPIVATPAGVSAEASLTGGSLTTGTYTYRIVARHMVSMGDMARSTASVAVSAEVATGSTGSVVVTWNAVPNATEYYVYAGSAGGQNRRYTVTAPTLTFTDTGAAGTTENVPTSVGTKWLVKNTLELKNCTNCVVEYNIIENSWEHGQTGYLVLLTPTTSSSSGDSNRLQGVDVRYNIIRSGAAGFQISGGDASSNLSDRTCGIRLHHNLLYDINGSYGASGRAILLTLGRNPSQFPRSPCEVELIHNTIDQTSGNASVYFNLKPSGDPTIHPIEDLIIRDNIFRKVNYGFMGPSGEGKVIPYQAGTSVYSHNVMSGASCSAYPAGTSCPSHTDLQTLTYMDYANQDFRVRPTSPFYNAGSDGTSYGADVDAIEEGTNIALSGDNTGGTQPDPLVITTGATLSSGMVGNTYSITIQATGGTQPYTCQTTPVSGTLPAGLTFSAACVLSGVPTTAGTVNFTLALDDDDDVRATKQFTLSIGEVLPSSRPERMDYQDGAQFVKEAAPGLADEIKVGDLWFDLATLDLCKLNATSPSSVWVCGLGTNASILSTGTVPVNRLGTSGTRDATTFLRGDNTWAAPAAGSSASPQTVRMSNDDTHSNVAVGGTELAGTRRARIRVDTQNYTQVALFFSVITACGGTSPVLRLEYWDGDSFEDAGVSGSCATGDALHEGAFVTLVAGARAQNTVFRGYISTGDGAADPRIVAVQVQFRE